MAEWLPEGWTVEVRVRKDGRKDRYYIDPVSGHVCRSMRDVLRFLTREQVRCADKQKDKLSSCVKMGYGTSAGQNLKWTETVRGKMNLKHPYARGWRPFSEHTSGEESSGPRGGTAKSVVIFLPAYGAPQAKQCHGKWVGTHIGQNESKTRMDSQSHPSSSKCPAQLKPIPPELSNNEQACQVAAVTQIIRQKTAPTKDSDAKSWPKRTFMQLDRCKAESGDKSALHPLRRSKTWMELDRKNTLNCDFTASGESAANMGENKKGSSPTLSLGNSVFSKENTEVIETTRTDKEKPGSPLGLPMVDSLSDPCIRFAAFSKGNTGAVEATRKDKEKPGSPLGLPMEDLWSDPCIGFAACSKGNIGTVETIWKEKEKPGSPHRLLLEDSWSDPCIEFAIKTLTGALPVGEESSIESIFQQQLG